MERTKERQRKIAKKILDALTLKVERREHRAHQEIRLANAQRKAEGSPPLNLEYLEMFGKYQYTFSNEIGEISLIHIQTGLSKKKLWEIYCLRGNLFEDVERFATKKEAEKRIRELLL